MLGPTFSGKKGIHTLIIIGPIFIDQIVIDVNNEGEFQQIIKYRGTDKEDKMSLDLKLVEQIVNVCKSLPVEAIKGRFSVRLAIKKDLTESELIAIGHSLIDKWVLVEDSSIVDLNGLQTYAKTNDISIFENYTK